MKRLTCWVILLQGLILGIAGTSLKTLAVSTLANTVTVDNGVKIRSMGNKGIKLQKQRLTPGQVWVLNKNQQVQPQKYIWVVKDTKKISEQPQLLIGKTPASTEKKPDDTPKSPKRDELEPFEDVIKDTEKSSGLFTLYRNKEKNKVYLEIKPEQLNKNFLTTATLESGIGEGGVYSGMPLQDFLFYFQRVNNNLQFVVRNVNFRTREGDPQARSLARSFSDSVLYNIPIKSINAERKTVLIDLADLLLTDIAGLSSSLGVAATSEQSYFGNAKAFPQNIEIESILNFVGGGSGRGKEPGLPSFDTLADSRGFTLRIHYSMSQLPENNYRPRQADERVGYFITAYQDLSNDDRNDPFVRYINRWNLEKQDPNAAISKPKKPIVFWIDNAVPYEYRDAIKQGILMWNQAFLQAGFQDAIQVQQMPDNATWDPADIRYNTIRWINTVDGYFAMGPSRVNPLTGEIFDADILVDASFVRALKNDYRQIVQPNQTQNQTQNRTSISTLMQNRMLCGNGLEAKAFGQSNQPSFSRFLGHLSRMAGEYDLCYGMEAVNQFAFGKMTMTMLPNIQPTSEQVKTYINQYLRLIVAHEVGHTLGLRHNFRGSNLLKPEDMNNTDVTSKRGLTASVMDYIPPNIAPKGTKQGNYFPTMVGPYDDWAIKYGYTPIPGATAATEKQFLQKLAQESAVRPELTYSTDEDMFDLDPTVNAWDNSGNVLLYSQWQLDNSRQLWDLINKRYPSTDESYSDVSERFGTVLGNYFQNLYFATKYIGGQSFYRVRANEGDKRLPFAPVSVEQQRQALATLQKYVFAEDAFNFPPDLLNKLAPSRWRHWGSTPRTGRLDFPIHDLVMFIQTSVLVDLLSGDRLSRLKDIELKTPTDKALTIPELFDTLQSGIWTEVIKSKNREIKISSLRRGLQRQYLQLLTAMVLRKGDEFNSFPEDARTIAWYKLKQLDEKLKSVDSKDEYTKAHILETRDRIKKILDARIQSN